MCSPRSVVFTSRAIREKQMVLHSCGYLNVRVCDQGAVPAELLLRLMAPGYCANMMSMVLQGIDRCEPKSAGTPL